MVRFQVWMLIATTAMSLVGCSNPASEVPGIWVRDIGDGRYREITITKISSKSFTFNSVIKKADGSLEKEWESGTLELGPTGGGGGEVVVNLLVTPDEETRQRFNSASAVLNLPYYGDTDKRYHYFHRIKNSAGRPKDARSGTLHDGMTIYTKRQ